MNLYLVYTDEADPDCGDNARGCVVAAASLIEVERCLTEDASDYLSAEEVVQLMRKKNIHYVGKAARKVPQGILVYFDDVVAPFALRRA